MDFYNLRSECQDDLNLSNSGSWDLNKFDVLRIQRSKREGIRPFRGEILFEGEDAFDPNLRDKRGRTALHYACNVFYFRDYIGALLKTGADPNLQDKNGTTALHLASERNDHYLVKALLKAGADPNIQDDHDQTVLHYWMSHDINFLRKDVLATLLKAGADPKIRAKNGVCPFYSELRWGYRDFWTVYPN